MLSELAGWSHGMNAKYCFVFNLNFNALSALLLPLSFPFFILYYTMFVTLLYVAIKSQKAILKPGITSWFNSNSFCIYLFLHQLGLLTFLHPTWKVEIFFHCMTLCFSFSFSKKRRIFELCEQKI